MQEATMNFIFALVVGKSINGNVKGKNALNNLWDYQPYVDLFISLALQNIRYMQMLQATATRTKPKHPNY